MREMSEERERGLRDMREERNERTVTWSRMTIRPSDANVASAIFSGEQAVFLKKSIASIVCVTVLLSGTTSHNLSAKWSP